MSIDQCRVLRARSLWNVLRTNRSADMPAPPSMMCFATTALGGKHDAAIEGLPGKSFFTAPLAISALRRQVHLDGRVHAQGTAVLAAAIPIRRSEPTVMSAACPSPGSAAGIGRKRSSKCVPYTDERAEPRFW